MRKLLQTGIVVSCTLALGGLAPSAMAQTACRGSTGPDVIVGDLTGPANYNASGGIEALSIGTTSCNLGTVWLNWIDNTNQHPVIGGNLYKYKVVDGVASFEQIGMSWLKHGFYALSGNLCCANCNATDGTHLGVGCSDPYTAERNGGQPVLGPRWQVNAHTGSFTYPPANPSWSGSTARRLEVAISDLEPSNGTTVRYFGEAQYVTPDDAAAGNQNNNASYREVTVTGSGNAWNFAFTGQTRREQSAIRAWKNLDSSVNSKDILIPNDGMLNLSYKVTELPGGMWHYEYAVYNMNADRGVSGLSFPTADGEEFVNAGFHDVTYRNGDGIGNTSYDGTDWAFDASNGTVGFATDGFAESANGNALRWGTTYNFRFDTSAPPGFGTLTLTLFKPGTPESVEVLMQVPSADCDDDGVADVQQSNRQPRINEQPQPQSLCVGDDLTLSVTAAGPSLSYQWRRGEEDLTDGGNISGATTSELTITGATAGDLGSYDVVVSNPCGSVTSDAVNVSIGTIPGDLDGSGTVDLADLAFQLSHFGETCGSAPCPGDVDGDLDVDLADLATLLSNFGASCR